MKYINKRNGHIAELIEENPKSKMVTLKYEDDGKFTGITESTFKRWWKKVDEETELVPVEEAPEVVPESLEELIPVPEEDKAGDGTPLVEVGKEIFEQAKEKSKKATDKKKKPVKEKINKQNVFNTMLSTLLDTLQENSYRYDVKDNVVYILSDSGKKDCHVYIGLSKYVLKFKEKAVPVDARPDSVRNCPYSHAFNIEPDKLNKLVKLLQGRR